VPPSCTGDLGAGSNCGSNLDNCCASITVPGGTYKRRYDGVTNNDGSFPATISAFKLDKFEFTRGRVRALANAGFGNQVKPPAVGQGAHPKIPGSGWIPSWNSKLMRTAADVISNLDSTPGDYPAQLDWYSAFAMCIADGGRLPTEAEWGFAASGGNEQRVFAWSQPANSLQIVPAQARYGNRFQTVGLTTGVSIWGHHDLNGNIAEWVLDRKSDLTPVRSCTDCAVTLESEPEAIVKGSTANIFVDRTAYDIRSAVHESITRVTQTGFRCARDL
jgi:formylglycine-generating enzyme